MTQSTKSMPGVWKPSLPKDNFVSEDYLDNKICDERIDGPFLPCDIDSLEEGMKFDEDKIRMELLPPEFLTSTASILTFGAKKYDDRNWEKGMDWSRVYGALQRHLNAWWSGEHTDPETGKSHLWHANCCMAFLTTYEMRGVGTDDRPYPREGFGNG